MFSAIKRFAEEAVVLDHNERRSWYNEYELLLEENNIFYPKNAKFIEAVSPAVVLQMLQLIEELQARVQTVEVAWDNFKIYNDTQKKLSDFGSFKEAPVRDSNARLIVAALESVMEMVKMIDDGEHGFKSPWYNDAVIAIEKATGEKS